MQLIFFDVQYLGKHFNYDKLVFNYIFEHIYLLKSKADDFCIESFGLKLNFLRFFSIIIYYESIPLDSHDRKLYLLWTRIFLYVCLFLMKKALFLLKLLVQL
ncbi:hypothetical protein EDEG_03406 [Edhazardia aedis USNM 41457]|uniref:Uncharacterized protein n=1 Tax=Edhazardia aedis (strain USNM 41457) TaxID=1003232 RepID=J9DHQ9_EDHAE|nr:hypothetical protein EDEG_03406 [Edhazardia aedis USNM 41457]|eukprot:EJW02150.1 hypothetical protein EDEG_03406 [Edhazardia aedis USNM 41457]